jgi:hypothetical protein
MYLLHVLLFRYGVINVEVYKSLVCCALTKSLLSLHLLWNRFVSRCVSRVVYDYITNIYLYLEEAVDLSSDRLLMNISVVYEM